MPVNYGSVPFAEQIRLFKNKLNIPTERWNDLQRDAHDTGFMVAGAAKADLLADLKNAVGKAIEQGTTLAEFRKDFNNIVAKHGWTDFTGSGSKDGIAWRTRVIYETNIRSSYQAGRWQQIQDGKAYRPYVQYKHSHAVITPREEHLRWDGVVLAVDDPWLQTHYPPNGFGCQCTVFALSERDLQRLGKSGPDPAPNDGTYEWTDKKTGEIYTFPVGVQPFWDYAPGASLASRAVEQLSRKLPGVPGLIGAELMNSLKPLILDEVVNQFAGWVDEVQAVNQSRNQTQLMGWIEPRVINHLTELDKAPQSAGLFAEDRLLVGKKAERHQAQGDALSTEEWKSLPAALMSQAKVYLDNDTGKLLYVLPSKDSRSIKIVIEMDFVPKKQASINLARTAYKINAQEFADTRRYTLLD